jgi:hypothetical protein
MKRKKLSEFPEIVLITALDNLVSSLKVGKMYKVDWVATHPDDQNHTFFLKGNGTETAISKNQFEFIEIKIEDKIV